MDAWVGNGCPCWVDLSTTDLAAATAFYAQLLGWDVVTNETPMGAYVVGSIEAREVAGMMAKSPAMAGSPSAWTLYFYVDDLDATLSAVVASGGAVPTEPFEIPTGARVAVVADPNGAMSALISRQLQPGPYLSTAVGAVSWVELMSRHPDRAMAFYHEVFGWEAATQDTGTVLYTTFSCDGSEVGGLIPTPDHLPEDVPDSWSVYFTAADCAATAARAVDLGGRVILAPTPTPVGPFAVLADPQGAVFQVMEYADG